jgi:hypothetical protein
MRQSVRAAQASAAFLSCELGNLLLMLEQKQRGRSRFVTVSADKAWSIDDSVRTLRELNTAPTKYEKGCAN